MNTFPPLAEERLFAPFLDEVDGTVCLPAGASASELEALLKPYPLRFPLFLDRGQSLRAQVAATTHAPASCRFGPYCDNIIGMNWRLPSGRMARIGERVVKTTTGFDWLRFLLHTGTRHGEPVDYVVRLRPDCGLTLTARFDGELSALWSCLPRLLRSGWMHWWESVDLLHDPSGAWLRVVVHCVPGEGPIFASQLEKVAAAQPGVALTLSEQQDLPGDGLPDLTLKTTPDRAPTLAKELAAKAERTIALCYNGVVHLYLRPGDDLPERAHAIAIGVAPELHEAGGDWHSHRLPATPPTLTESSWLNTLEQSLHGS